MHEAAWTHARKAYRWLMSATKDGLFDDGHAEAMRLMKVTEEAGEATQAYIGLVGQNPRKGFTHTTDDVLSELFDVIIAAMVSMHDFTSDPERIFDEVLAAKAARLAVLTGERGN